MPRAVSIYLPRWAIWRARRRSSRLQFANRNQLERIAWLLCTTQHGVQQVACCCERAAAAGARAGMTVAHARSLLVGMTIEEQPYSPAEDTLGLRRLARWMLRLAPIVSLDVPDGLMLDIAGCERLFGGERRHVQKIATALRAFGLRPRIAVAPTFAGAWALARFGKEHIAFIPTDMDQRLGLSEALASLPVCALRIDADTMDALADVGIERIEHLFALPREELAARYGSELLRRLDQATGVAPEHIESVQLLPRFEASHVFDGPVKRIEAIEVTTRELLSSLLAELQTRGRGVLELAVELRRIDLQPTVLTLTLTHPNRDHNHLWALLWPRLERAHLGYGVEELTLRATRTGYRCEEQTAFLREAGRGLSDDPRALGELLDRLIDRLGSDAVAQIEPVESYVPEAAFVHQLKGTRDEGRGTRGMSSPPQILVADRPSQLFDRPEQIRVMSLVPDGPPVWLEWRGKPGTVIASLGPERIAFPWWLARNESVHPEGGMGLYSDPCSSSQSTGLSTDPCHPFLLGNIRDYFETEDEHGRRLWIYRQGQSGQWFVHGQWA